MTSNSTDGLAISQELKDFLNAEFDTSKGRYKPHDKPFFCVKCCGESLTESQADACRALNHVVFKGMKCSGVYGYLQDDIKKVVKIENVNNVCKNIKDELDVQDVCAFSVNKYLIYFPKTRQHSGVQISNDANNIGNGLKCCRTCGFDLKNRNQIKTDFFCSILCKLKCNNIEELRAMNPPAPRNIINLSVRKDSKKIKKESHQGDKMKKKKKKKKSRNNENLESVDAVVKNVGHNFSANTNTNIFSLRKRSRKGVHRVPTRAALK